MTTTVTVVTAAKSLAIEAASIVDGLVDGSGHLILTKHDTSTIDAGSVVGPTGPTGSKGDTGDQGIQGLQGPAGDNTYAALPAYMVVVKNFSGPSQPSRPTSRTDIVVRWRGPFLPTAAVTGDECVVTA